MSRNRVIYQSDALFASQKPSSESTSGLLLPILNSCIEFSPQITLLILVELTLINTAN